MGDGLSILFQLLPNSLVHFHNKKGFEAGRLLTESATWVSRLLDLGYIRIEGRVADIPSTYSSGMSASHSLENKIS